MRSRSWQRSGYVLAAALSAGACAGVAPEPASLASAGVILDAPRLAAFDHRIELEPRDHPEVVVEIDEILATNALNDPAFRAAVERWVVYWQATAAGAVPDFLGRMGSFGALVDSA
ncbi:MAG: hypothetical protein ABL963_13990, partial [Longimicrobiales bacterium]